MADDEENRDIKDVEVASENFAKQQKVENSEKTVQVKLIDKQMKKEILNDFNLEDAHCQSEKVHKNEEEEEEKFEKIVHDVIDKKELKKDSDNSSLEERKDCLQLPEHESNKLDVLPNTKIYISTNDEEIYNKQDNGNINFGPSEEEEIKQRVDDNLESHYIEQKRVGWMRHYVAIFALVGIVLANMNRQAFNQALVKMARQSKISPSLTTTTTTISPLSSTTITNSFNVENISTTTIFYFNNENSAAGELLESTTTTTEAEENLINIYEDYDTFDWNSDEISKLQSAFSYGYTPLMIFSARISELYGAKWVIFLSGFGSALCCVLSPFFADTNYYLLILSRVLMGLCQTGVSPALYALLVRWLPPEESSVYLPMMKVGATLGFTFGSVIAGFFSWRHTFYIVAIIGFIWSIIWPITVESDPDKSRFISDDEFKFIRQEIGKLNKFRKQSANSSRKQRAPWIQIMTHPVVLAFMFTKLTVKMSTDAQTQQFAMYLKAVFNMSDTNNGLLNGINYAIQALFTGVVAWSAQQFVIKKIWGLSKTGVRRLFQGICNFGMGLAFISITFNMSSIELVCSSYLLLSIASMFGAGGEAVLPVDLTTDYAATIMSIANFTANLSGIILPKIVAIILGNNRTDPDRWNLIWWIVGGIMCFGGLLFSFFAKAEILNFENNFLINLIRRIRGNRKMKRKANTNIEKDFSSSMTTTTTTNINNTTAIQMTELPSIKETSD